jgi:hypothetical protein
LKLAEYKHKYGFVQFYAFVIGILLLAFYLGYVFADRSNSGLGQDVKVMRQSVENLTRENQSLNSQINTMKIALDVARLTQQESQTALQDAASREIALKQELAFFQRVMAPELTQDGFVVERLAVTATQSTNNYAVSMVLLQHENIKDIIKGDLDIEISGSLDGKPKTYALSELQDEPKTPLKFGFKYFQVIETTITLPANFIPEKFELETDVYKYNRRRGSYNTSITWVEAFSEAE